MFHAATSEWERRTADRLEVVRPCKIYVPRMEKYFHGTTWNISDGGVLLQLSRVIALEQSERVLVGIATKRRDVILKADEMLEAHVLRALKTPSDSTALALQFAAPIDLAHPHMLREAA
jgi:c-di-GMP-binding flagellar brake protein YcgR